MGKLGVGNDFLISFQVNRFVFMASNTLNERKTEVRGPVGFEEEEGPSGKALEN